VFLDREHVPPKQVSHPSVILDLGANIGLTMAHFATLFPAARILGAELDPDNAALCVENTERWRDRCEVVAAGVWVRDGTVPYVRREGREVSHAIAEAAADATSWTTAISIDSLLQRLPATTEVDYMKMDIEGAEREVLRSGQSWAPRVSAIKVEIHPPYAAEDCEADLQALGFETQVERRRCTYVVGVRAQQPLDVRP